MHDNPLHSFLNDQLNLLDVEQHEKECIKALIDHIDPNGYLGDPLEHIAESGGTHIRVEHLEDALKTLQGFQPSGVGARTLKECLHLQLSHNTAVIDAAHLIIRNHLEDMHYGRLSVIVASTGVNIAVVKAAVEVIRKLSAKPGLRYS
jgi:RNA polymerase sigma-54 factor